MGFTGAVAEVAGTALSDAELVSAVRAGDDAAFAELFRRYGPRIRGYVQRRLGDSGRAEDVTQEAFLSALRHIRASDAQIVFKPWLFEIARNATIDAHRRSSRAEELPVDDAGSLRPADQQRLAGGPAPDSQLFVKESMDHLRGAFDELPPKHHRALVMRELEGLSYREIGDRLELTKPAVESTLFRARRRLAHEYEELAAGRRCQSARAAMVAIAEGADAGSERRRMARHVRRCSACRRRARELGVLPQPRLERLRNRAAALLPLPWLLRRRMEPGMEEGGGLLAGAGAQISAMAAERTAALLAAAALAGAGSAVLADAGGVGPDGPRPAASEPAASEAGVGGAPTRSIGETREPPLRGTRGRALPSERDRSARTKKESFRQNGRGAPQSGHGQPRQGGPAEPGVKDAAPPAAGLPRPQLPQFQPPPSGSLRAVRLPEATLPPASTAPHGNAPASGLSVEKLARDLFVATS